jgi:hypothetical protein
MSRVEYDYFVELEDECIAASLTGIDASEKNWCEDERVQTGQSAMPDTTKPRAYAHFQRYHRWCRAYRVRDQSSPWLSWLAASAALAALGVTLVVAAD